MSAVQRRVLEALCLVGIIGCATLMIRIGFVRGEDVGDTHCYPTLWQRNGRRICEASNRRRDLQMLAAMCLGVALGIGARRLHRRSFQHLVGQRGPTADGSVR